MSKKSFIYVCGFATGVAWAITLAWTWFLAYFNPTHSITIYINRLGEMQAELILIPTILFFCIATFLFFFKDYLIEIRKEIEVKRCSNK